MVVGSITLGFASSGVSQVRMTSPVPPTPDVDETLESVDSSEEGGVFSAIEADSQAVVSEIDHQSVRERHKDYRFGVAAMLGQVKPWQSYGLEVGWMASPAWYLALYGGQGKISGTGSLADRLSYRATIQSSGGGALARYYLSQFDFINFEGSLSLHRWRGTINSLNTDDAATGDRLTAYQFSGKGGSLSLAMNVGWVTGGGYFFEWTPIGFQVGRLMQMDAGGGDAAINQALNHDIQGVRIFGLVGLRAGRLF
jgi:hypothetical protein